jgi:hypothetical protein
MKSTWKKSHAARRRNLRRGAILFVVGIGITSYIGYMERHLGDPQADFLKLLGWGLLLAGLVLFLIGMLQSPVGR